MFRISKARETIKIIFVISVVIFTIATIIYSFFLFNTKLNELTLKDSMKQLEDLTVYVEKSFNLEIDHCLRTLETSNIVINSEDDLFSNEAISKLIDIQNQSSFYLTGIATLDGHGIDSNGSYKHISNKEMFERIKQGKIYISNSIKTNNPSLIYIAVPLRNTQDEISAVLWAKYRLSNLFEDNNMANIGSQFFQIIDDQGNYILDTSKKSIFSSQGYKRPNLWRAFEIYDFPKAQVNEIRENITNSKSGVAYFDYKGHLRFVLYKPLKINNWYIFSVLMLDKLKLFTSNIKSIVVDLYIVLSLCLVSLFAIVATMIYNMYKRLSNQHMHIKDISTLFHVILQKTNNIPFVVDKKLKKVILYGYPIKGVIQTCTYQQLSAENMIDKGLIDKDSVKEYQKLYQAVVVEERACDPVVIFSILSDRKIWFRVSTIFDERKNPNKIFGVLESYDELRDSINNREHDRFSEQEQIKLDFLTHVLNRQAFIDRTQEALRDDFANNICSAFLIIDLDNFTDINALMGQEVGDKILQNTANVLMTYFRQEDIVGRLGGDEFVVYARNVTDIDAFELRINKLNELLTKAYKKDKHQVVATASIGIMLTDKDHITFNSLYEKADIALYSVKESAKNSYAIYKDN